MKGYGYLVAFLIAVASVKGAAVKDKLEAREVQPADMDKNKHMMNAKRQYYGYYAQGINPFPYYNIWNNAVPAPVYP
ncbi:hypothetical protein BB560_007315, partial [Smittium megazygosporum]